MRLTETKEREWYCLKSITMPNKALACRLMEMGWVAGTPLKILKLGKKKSFVYVSLRGYELSLGAKVASYICVEPLKA